MLCKKVDNKNRPLLFDHNWYNNGQMMFRYIYIDDTLYKKHGVQNGWYENGQLKFEHNYIDGKQHGIQKGWYENGQLEYEEILKYDIPNGIQKTYYENGRLMCKANFQDGILKKYIRRQQKLNPTTKFNNYVRLIPVRVSSFTKLRNQNGQNY